MIYFFYEVQAFCFVMCLLYCSSTPGSRKAKFFFFFLLLLLLLFMWRMMTQKLGINKCLPEQCILILSVHKNSELQ